MVRARRNALAPARRLHEADKKSALRLVVDLYVAAPPNLGSYKTSFLIRLVGVQALLLHLRLLGALMLAALPLPGAAADVSVGHVTGIGGIFVTSKDPRALAAWYHDMLGLPLEPWGGAVLRYDAPMHPPKAAWMALPSGSKYMAPSSREFMLDFAVDDLDAIVARLTAKGVKILKRDDTDPSGRFAWILDPDGTKIELWQAKTK